MKLFFFYAFCTVKNNLRRLLHTWVAVVMAACLVLGLLVGLGVAMLEEAMGPPIEELPEETLPEEPPSPADEALAATVAELVLCGVILLSLVYAALSSEKNGSIVFLPADVQLLFPAPMRPQSVLLFRLTVQMGGMLLLLLWLPFQVPLLVTELGLAPAAVLLCLLALCLLLVFSRLLHILLYTLCATRPTLRRLLRPVVFSLLFCVGLCFYLTYQNAGGDPLAAAEQFFCAPWTRLIPIYGWLKGLCLYALEGAYLPALLCLLGLLLSATLLAAVIWQLKADFYEDAMAKSAETAEAQQNAEEGRSILTTRKKDRRDSLQRDGLHHGQGASIYFFKTLYNRFRFAHLRIFTKTSETYLLAALGVALLCLLVFGGTSPTAPVMLTVCALAFFRSLGNPLGADTQLCSFFMVPEPAHTKVFWSLLGGSTVCLLDLLPAALVAAFFPGGDPLAALFWLFFILSVDLYATTAALFLDVSLPLSLAKTVKSVILILFIYFGLLPDAALLAIGLALGYFPLFACLAAVLNLALGMIFFALSPWLLERGRR